MLILTDRPKNGHEVHYYLTRARPCDVVGLNEVDPRPSNRSVIVCGAEIGDEPSLKRLGGALTRLR